MEPLPGNVIANVDGAQLLAASNWLHQAAMQGAQRGVQYAGMVNANGGHITRAVRVQHQCTRCWHGAVDYIGLGQSTAKH